MSRPLRSLLRRLERLLGRKREGHCFISQGEEPDCEHCEFRGGPCTIVVEEVVYPPDWPTPDTGSTGVGRCMSVYIPEGGGEKKSPTPQNLLDGYQPI